MANQEYLTVGQVAEMLQVSKTIVYKWAKIGVLKGYKIGPRLIRFKKSEVIKSLKVEGEDDTGEHMADKV